MKIKVKWKVKAHPYKPWDVAMIPARQVEYWEKRGWIEVLDSNYDADKDKEPSKSPNKGFEKNNKMVGKEDANDTSINVEDMTKKDIVNKLDEMWVDFNKSDLKSTLKEKLINIL